MGHDFEKEFFKEFESPLEAREELGEFEQLDGLILRMQDGVIKKKDFLKLQQWLLTDSRALEHYVDYAYLCAGLTILLGKKRDNSFLEHHVNVQN